MALRSEDLVYRFARPEPSAVSLPGQAARARARAARVRAARRHRVAVARRRLALVLTGILIVAFFILGDGPGAQAPASRAGTPRSVVVHSGDTLWELADEYAPPSVDPRDYVQAIVDLNALEGQPQVGDRLRLPQ